MCTMKAYRQSGNRQDIQYWNNYNKRVTFWMGNVVIVLVYVFLVPSGDIQFFPSKSFCITLYCSPKSCVIEKAGEKQLRFGCKPTFTTAAVIELSRNKKKRNGIYLCYRYTNVCSAACLTMYCITLAKLICMNGCSSYCNFLVCWIGYQNVVSVKDASQNNYLSHGHTCRIENTRVLCNT